MKKITALILFFSLFLSMAGCSSPSSQYEQPVRFFYPVKMADRKDGQPIIEQEVREGLYYRDSLQDLVNFYIHGPKNQELYSPVPADAYAVKIMQNGRRATIYMSNAFARLTGMDLTLACFCLGHTLIEYKQLDQVSICVKDTLLDGKESIVIRKGAITLWDDSLTQPTTPS